jgi:hypothetical protein
MPSPLSWWCSFAPLVAVLLLWTANRDAALFAHVSAPGIAADDQAFTLGVLRTDGVVLPFATYDGRKWSSSWPWDIKAQELPINLDSIPGKWWGRAARPQALSLWSGGERLGEVTLERPAIVPVLCDTRIGIRTSTRADVVLPSPFEPVPKQGLAISGTQQIGDIARISRLSDDWKRTGEDLAAAVDEAETVAARRFTDWRHPIGRADRRKAPVVLEALYRLPMDEPGWGSASYVEAVKEYPPGPQDEECGLVTSVSGWIRYPPKGAPKYDVAARITYCDRRGVTYMLPLGSLTIAGRIYWVFQTSGWTGEWYSVARASSKGVDYMVDYFAGRGCLP